MSLIDEALAANMRIAGEDGPTEVKPPAPRVAIVTCADPRVTGITRLLGFHDEDVDLIRNVGSVVDEGAVRSLIISTQVLGTREIMIINHTDCGMLRFTDQDLQDRLRDATGNLPLAPTAFSSFTDTEQNTREQMLKARSHPWISPDVPVRGFVLDLHTGLLSEVSPLSAGAHVG